VRGTWWQSCGDGGAFMAGVSSFGCGGPDQPPAEEPSSSQRSNNARIRASPLGALRAGSRTSGRKSARTARPVCVRRYKITSARKSLTLVCVGPVTSRSPIAVETWWNAIASPRLSSPAAYRVFEAGPCLRHQARPCLVFGWSRCS
jgi:hypothetical protein